jgi:hypothetical protein
MVKLCRKGWRFHVSLFVTISAKSYAILLTAFAILETLRAVMFL